MPSYTFSFVAFDDLRAIRGNPLTTSGTTGTNGVFSVNADASPISITVNDDDAIFHDAFIDTGTSQRLASDLTVNGRFFGAGSIVELEFSVSTNTGDTFHYIRIGGVNVGIGGTEDSSPQPGQRYRITGSSDGQQEAYEDLACFAEGTPIDTTAGPRRIETLTLQDKIVTQSNGARSPLWIGKRFVGEKELHIRPDWAPVRIAAGALGNHSELVVSPQHRILISDWRAEFYFGVRQIFVPALALVDGAAITVDPIDRPVVYYHLLFDRHEVVFSSGFPSESYYPENKAEDSVAAAAKAEIQQLFPDVAAAWKRHGYGPLAHTAARPGLAKGINWSDAA